MGLGKCYRIYPRPQDRLKQSLASRLRVFARTPASPYYREFWALRDLSFDVRRGQTVGIIGRNGSGKSTLLQIIAGTLAPTTGTVRVEGRTSALLELGSGFNPEFTGRENVYLNATLLGLSQQEVEQKFDSIAAFADIGEYLDQPVKTYSSGMTLRLAFAVQVAVDAEVLIIDEALAVGDARFQLKCFRRLEELKQQGATILFVSHATDLVRSFCDVGLVLERGGPVFWGEAKAATVTYLSLLFPERNAAIAEPLPEATAPAASPPKAGGEDALVLYPEQMDTHSFGVGGAVLERLDLYGLDRPNVLVGGRTLRARCEFSWEPVAVRNLIRAEGYAPNITLGIALSDRKGSYLFGCNGFDAGLAIDCLAHVRAEVELRITLPHLGEGDYFLTAAIALGDLKHHVQLKWYDCMLQLKYEHGERNVFGVLAVDYDVELISSEALAS